MTNSIVVTSTAPGSPDIVAGNITAGSMINLEPLVQESRNWTKWAGPLISILILATVIYQLRHLDYRGLAALMPSSPLFWVTLVATYLVSPAVEWVIFRRLWSLPTNGFAALLRKFVSNEILLGYLGEVYFYAWARRNARVGGAPFGAIKDVTILSAFTGNLFTLIMVAVSAPLLLSLHLHINGTAFIASALFILGTSAAAMLLRQRLFTLSRQELWFVGGAHSARILMSALLSAVAWHLLLPSVAVSWWLILVTARQLLSRLPFLPNKDVVFAGVAVFLVGSDHQIVAAMTLMATLILAMHLLVGGVLGLTALIEAGRES